MVLKIFKWIVISVVLLVLLLWCFVAPIDRTPIRQRAFYKEMMHKLDTIQWRIYPGEELKVGWSQYSIVPQNPTRMAGYGIRKKHTKVRDTVYVRVLAFSNGNASVHVITADLLLFPPALKRKLLQRQAQGVVRSDFIFFTATHTHSSIGGWDASLLGNVLFGNYDEAWIDEQVAQIERHMVLAYQHAKKTSLYNIETNAAPYVYHRALRISERIDAKIRGLHIVREDSSKALFYSYSGHPTMLPKDSTALSTDYPAEVEKNLRHVYDHVQFAAGMMASHAINRLEGPKEILRIGKGLASLIEEAPTELMSDEPIIRIQRVPVLCAPSQLRIARNWKLRNWLFENLAGPLTSEIEYLQIGNFILLGLSADFSGEIAYANRYDSIEQTLGYKLCITGYNGEYTGYITADYLYDGSLENTEVTILNWVGPYHGSYYNDMIKKIVFHK